MLAIKNKSNLPAIAPSSPPEADFSYLDHEPDWTLIERLSAKYRFVDKIILVAHGGSVNTFRGIYTALCRPETPEVITVDTNDPSFLKKTKERIVDEDKTLLLSISKSGTNTSQIESTLYFYDIPNKIFITGSKGVLRQMSSRDKSIEVMGHPDVGGRFSSFTEISLLPGLLCGFNMKELRMVLKSGRDYINNLAFETAQIIWELEQKDINQVLVSTYSQALADFNTFIQQIVHETVGKEGLGVTVIPVESPESQHHTSQRLFDGRKNIAVLFSKSTSRNLSLEVDDNLHSIEFFDKQLSDFNGVNLRDSLEAEYKGTKQRADDLNIPNLTLDLSSVNSETLGEYILFWHMFAIYSAYLRNLNPFNQPAVEASKEISFKERFE